MPQPTVKFSVAAGAIGATPKALRLWLQRGQVAQPVMGRTRTGRLAFADRDIRRLALIRVLVDYGVNVRTADTWAGFALDEGWRRIYVWRDAEAVKAGNREPSRPAFLVVDVGSVVMRALARAHLYEATGTPPPPPEAR